MKPVSQSRAKDVAAPKMAYVAPAVTRISPERAKELLLQNGGASDLVGRLMLDRIEKILGGETPQQQPK